MALALNFTQPTEFTLQRHPSVFCAYIVMDEVEKATVQSCWSFWDQWGTPDWAKGWLELGWMTVEVGCALSHLDLPIVEAAEVHTYTVFTQVPYYFDFHLYSDLLLLLFLFFLMKILFIAQMLLVGRSRLSLTVKWSVKASWIALLFLSSETCSSTQEISCVCIKIARCS